MIKLSYDDFLRACPSATTPSQQIFRDIEAIIEDSAEKLIEVLGPDLAKRLDETQSGIGDAETTAEWMVLRCAKRFVALDAYATAIPQLDLVLTSTGFGVVQNQNVAPASSDRVARLLNRILRSKDEAFDILLSEIRRIPTWGETREARKYITSLFWRAYHMRYFGIAEPMRSDLHRHAVDISTGEAALKKLMGREQWEALLEYERKEQYDIILESIMDECRRFVGAMYAGQDPERFRRYILQCLDTYDGTFAAYHKSSAYQANHFEPYRNRKNDTTFFFG